MMPYIVLKTMVYRFHSSNKDRLITKMKDIITSTTNCDEKILLGILKASKIGIAKRELTDRLPTISHAQLRRCFAELVDKKLLHYDELQHIYITTDRGIILIRNMEKLHNNIS